MTRLVMIKMLIGQHEHCLLMCDDTVSTRSVFLYLVERWYASLSHWCSTKSRHWYCLTPRANVASSLEGSLVRAWAMLRVVERHAVEHVLEQRIDRRERVLHSDVEWSPETMRTTYHNLANDSSSVETMDCPNLVLDGSEQNDWQRSLAWRCVLPCCYCREDSDLGNEEKNQSSFGRRPGRKHQRACREAKITRTRTRSKQEGKSFNQMRRSGDLWRTNR